MFRIGKNDTTRKIVGTWVASFVALSAFGGAWAQDKPRTYEVTVTNLMATELIAPVLLAPTDADSKIFDGSYVTPEAEELVLTGDPSMLAAKIGWGAFIGQGEDGPPGRLLAPGKSLSFEIITLDPEVRVIAMVAPTVTPDNYLTATFTLDPDDGADGKLARFDIGHDENTKTTTSVAGEEFAAVTITRK